jgi:hypothetical protein
VPATAFRRQPEPINHKEHDMPTGYTAAVKDGISFEQFVWHCARAFGALVMMRDDPSDAVVPQRFEESPYYRKALEEAKDRLATVRAMSLASAEENARHAHTKALKEHGEREAAKDDLRNKYSAMLAQVVKWSPPSSEHTGLKDFMLQQLRESIDWDCKPYPAPEPITNAAVWLADQIADAERAVERKTQALADEVERVAGRNRWIADLRASVPQPTP